MHRQVRHGAAMIGVEPQDLEAAVRCSRKSRGTESLPAAAFTPISAKDTTLNSRSVACSIASRAADEIVRDPASCQSTT